MCKSYIPQLEGDRRGEHRSKIVHGNLKVKSFHKTIFWGTLTLTWIENSLQERELSNPALRKGHHHRYSSFVFDEKSALSL